MFVRISADTISSLTMHFINQFSKQTKWLWWIYISEKNSIICIIYSIIPNSITLSLIIVENVDPVASELSLGNLLKMFQIK